MLHKTLQSQYPGFRYHLVYEAGFSGYTLYEYFNGEGIDIIVTPPNRIPRDNSRVKNDKMDSRKLAQYLISGLLKKVLVPTKDVQHYRLMFTILDKLKSQRKQIINQLKSILFYFNHPLSKEKWSTTLQIKLELISFPQELFNAIFYQQLEHLRVLEQHIGEMGKRIKEIANDPQYSAAIQHLDSIKGIGLLSAIRLTVFLFDRPDRFTSSERICNYVGLTPSEHSSGDKEYRGKITRIGDKQLRALLVQMAWVAVRHDGDLLMKFEDLLAKGKNKKRAIIAVTRRFLVKIYQSLKKGEPYESHLGLTVTPESLKELPQNV
ncbi:MAG: IS110 family transposase [Calditrichia bacterium]